MAAVADTIPDGHDAVLAPPRRRRREDDRCLVVGGGVAGVAAAIAAADRGLRPILLERGRLLGGMARSFPVAGLGDVDCGQHVVLRCCSAYLGLLRRLGTADRISLQRHLRVTVVDSSGRSSTLAELPVPAPLHLAPSLVRLPFLHRHDLRAIARACWRLRWLDDLSFLDRLSFAEWLEDAWATPSRRAFWDLICTATCNLDSATVSAAVAAFVLREGFLLRRRAAAIGVPRVGLGRLLEPAVALITAAGGEVRLGTAVDAVLVDGDRLVGVRTATGEEIPGGRVVVAGPPRLLARVAPAVASHPRFAAAQDLTTSPIVNVLLHFDRPVLDAPIVAVWDSPLQWLFSRTRLRGEDGPGETVVCSLSAAEGVVDQPTPAILDWLLPALWRAQPRSGRAHLERWLVTRERHATVALTPGSAARRAGPRTPIPGLVVAGAWTATGWPITMESAVRSAKAAVATLAAAVPR